MILDTYVAILICKLCPILEIAFALHIVPLRYRDYFAFKFESHG